MKLPPRRIQTEVLMQPAVRISVAGLPGPFDLTRCGLYPIYRPHRKFELLGDLFAEQHGSGPFQVFADSLQRGAANRFDEFFGDYEIDGIAQCPTRSEISLPHALAGLAEFLWRSARQNGQELFVQVFRHLPKQAFVCPPDDTSLARGRCVERTEAAGLERLAHPSRHLQQCGVHA